MLTAVLSVFAMALAAPFLAPRLGAAAKWVFALLPAAIALYFARHLEPVAAGGTVRQSTAWIGDLGINLSFYLDGLSLLFALLVSGIGALIVVYGGAYLKGDGMLPRFYLFILAFMGSMLGLVLADNLILLYVFWELTSITSFLLIGYNHADAQARRSALQALLVTASGGLAMLAGFILLAIAGGTYELSVLLTRADQILAHPLYLPALVLILLGCFTKSAQVPFHFWLPNAMDAPTPVSAYLHSATMVKAGVYLLARLNPAMGGTEIWTVTLVAFGSVTALWAALMALRQTDLKRILAYTTCTALGQLIVLIGIGTEYAMEAFAAFLLAHALYKAALFMGAGAVDHEAGTRDVRSLGGLLTLMPVTALGVGLAALSKMGLPPFFGFIGKEWMYEGTLSFAAAAWVATGVMVVANACMVATGAIVFFKPFLGRRVQTPKPAHEGPPGLWVGAVLLTLTGLGFGLMNHLPEQFAVAPAAQAVAGRALDVDLYLFKEVKPSLIVSVVTLVLAALVYVAWTPVRGLLDRMAAASMVNLDAGYDRVVQGMVALANWQTAVLQSGRLRYYMAATVSGTTLVIGVTLVARGGFTMPVWLPPVPWWAWAMAGVIIGGVGATVASRSRLGGILALGVLGITVAVLFLMFGAPDVAITQFMAETLIVIIVALVLARLPALSRYEREFRHQRLRDGAIAIAIGVVVTAIMLSVVAEPTPDQLSGFFAENSYTGGFGRNVVNVILVDFRALDTLGEILVVAVAGLGAFALLKLRPSRPASAAPSEAD